MNRAPTKHELLVCCLPCVTGRDVCQTRRSDNCYGSESEDRMTSEAIEVALPRMRYDLVQPLLDGRVEIPGVTLKEGRNPGGGFLSGDNPALREGDFGLT